VLRLSEPAAAFSWRAKFCVALPALAVIEAVCAVPTAVTVAENAALAALAGTVTLAGTTTAVLLLARVTTIPPEGAKPFSVTVQASVPAPVIEALPQESDFKLASPVPLRVTVVEAPVEELLAIAIWPVAVPEVVGSN
jgi:hypothetical protein